MARKEKRTTIQVLESIEKLLKDGQTLQTQQHDVVVVEDGCRETYRKHFDKLAPMTRNQCIVDYFKFTNFVSPECGQWYVYGHASGDKPQILGIILINDNLALSSYNRSVFSGIMYPIYAIKPFSSTISSGEHYFLKLTEKMMQSNAFEVKCLDIHGKSLIGGSDMGLIARLSQNPFINNDFSLLSRLF